MKFLILGAGPAGLSFANCLKKKGISDFLILEKEETSGGLCRSECVDGAPFDIGGGHFLDVRRPVVNNFLFQFMPESEWNIFNRDSRICLHDTLINHPMEANIWQLPVDDQIEYLKSIANAGCNTGKEKPENFIDWISWKLGNRISADYMIPYNQKMFGESLNELGTYWLDKLPNVSFEDTLRSCLLKQAFGTQPGHARFYYPKKSGYGELWNRMATAIQNNILYKKEVRKIDFDRKSVITADGAEYSASIIVTSIPWAEFHQYAGMPECFIDGISKLKYSSIQTEYHETDIDTDCHWIYYPSQELSYHRILVRKNFCPDSRGYWTETNSNRIENIKSYETFRYLNKYAYPLNTIDKPRIMKELLSWCSEHGVYGLGRWGEHQHYNSDLTVELAMKLADELTE